MQRVLVSVLTTATTIVAKAFMQAYAQARGGAGAAAGAAGKAAAGKPAGAGAVGGGMDVMQARAILQVARGADKDEIVQKFQKYFKANDPDAGGSFYLQSKVATARDVLLDDARRRRPAPAAAAKDALR